MWENFQKRVPVCRGEPQTQTHGLGHEIMYFMLNLFTPSSPLIHRN
jgi:hypothetical protein